MASVRGTRVKRSIGSFFTIFYGYYGYRFALVDFQLTICGSVLHWIKEVTISICFHIKVSIV